MKPVLQPPPSVPKERLGNDCFRCISIDASGPYDMKKCGVCNFSAICENVTRKDAKKKEKLMYKRIIVRPNKFGYLCLDVLSHEM